MEGPSLVIATEEFRRFEKKKITKSSRKELVGQKFLGTMSWGKHLILRLSKINFRIHFLMFGSYRINHPRENRIPKLQIEIGNDVLYFYSCAIKEISDEDLDEYDFSIDAMSEEFSTKHAVKTLKAKPDAMVCDVLMDQSIFAGVGNIIKNEVQWNCRLHPETKLKDVSIPALVKETIRYCHQFYEWKKQNVLKRNWKIFRKKKCPECGKKVTKKATGKLERISHYCPTEQKKGLQGNRRPAKN